MLRRNPAWLKALRPRATESSTVAPAGVRAWFRKRRDTPGPMNPTDWALIMNQRRRSESYNDRRGALLCYLHELSHGGDGVAVPYEHVGSETGQVAGEGHHAPREGAEPRRRLQVHAEYLLRKEPPSVCGINHHRDEARETGRLNLTVLKYTGIQFSSTKYPCVLTKENERLCTCVLELEREREWRAHPVVGDVGEDDGPGRHFGE